MNHILPVELTQGATQAGKEYAWSIASFPSALATAPSLGYACLGGQFQFRFSDQSIFEFYWLEANSSDKKDPETWESYAQRSCGEVLAEFNRLLQVTDFKPEAQKFESLGLLIDAESSYLDCLVFNAYFISEADLLNLDSEISNGRKALRKISKGLCTS